MHKLACERFVVLCHAIVSASLALLNLKWWLDMLKNARATHKCETLRIKESGLTRPPKHRPMMVRPRAPQTGLLPKYGPSGFRLVRLSNSFQAQKQMAMPSGRVGSAAADCQADLITKTSSDLEDITTKVLAKHSHITISHSG